MSWTLLKTAEKSEDEDSDFYVISDESPDEDDNRLTVTLRSKLFPTLREGTGVP